MIFCGNGKESTLESNSASFFRKTSNSLKRFCTSQLVPSALVHLNT